MRWSPEGRGDPWPSHWACSCPEKILSCWVPVSPWATPSRGGRGAGHGWRSAERDESGCRTARTGLLPHTTAPLPARILFTFPIFCICITMFNGGIKEPCGVDMNPQIPCHFLSILYCWRRCKRSLGENISPPSSLPLFLPSVPPSFLPPSLALTSSPHASSLTCFLGLSQ